MSRSVVCRLAIVAVVTLVVATFAVAGKLAPQTADQRPEDTEAIRSHIDSIFQAYIGKDRQSIRATHSDEWRGFLRPSREVIKGIEGYMQAAEAALSGPYGLSGYRFIEYDTIFYGETAIVNYIAELVPRQSPFRPMIRVLDVYVRLDGHWNQVASQTAPHPDTLAAGRQRPAPVPDALRRQILDARQEVWQSWFMNGSRLAEVIPPELVAINNGDPEWKDRQAVLASAAAFSESGGKLLRLDFPKTEIQLYGDVAILYTLYELEFQVDGQATTMSGRGTEIFVRRDGDWVNSGWHLDSGS